MQKVMNFCVTKNGGGEFWLDEELSDFSRWSLRHGLGYFSKLIDVIQFLSNVF